MRRREMSRFLHKVVADSAWLATTILCHRIALLRRSSFPQKVTLGFSAQL